MTYRRVMRLPWLVALVPLTACGPDESTGACKESFLAGDLVITEVFADYAAPEGGTGTDDGKEWFEIYNNSDRPVSLKGVSIVHSKIDGTKPSTHVLKDVTIAPGQFFTLGNATQDLLPAYVDYGFAADLADFFNTGGGLLTLKCGNEEIDSAAYDAVKSGHSRQLTNQSPPDYTLNDDQVNWCEAKDTEFETNNFGTPGSDNDCAPVIAGACSDNGVMRDAVAPVAGDLVITEVMPNPAGTSDTTAEWVEVLAKNAVDLNGLSLDRAGDTSGGDDVTSASCLHLAAGDYAIFAKSSDATMNGMLPAARLMGTFSFSLVDGTTAAPADVQILFGGTVLDSITWTSTRSGRSHQLASDRYDITQNDYESNFCDGTTMYFMNGATTDYGTPGQPNVQCPVVVPAGMCDDNGTLRPIRKPAAGALVITEFLADALDTAGDPTQEWFEIKNTSSADFDLNELLMKGNGVTTYPIGGGNCINVAPGAYALFAHGSTTATNGGLPAVDATFSFALANSSGSITILDGSTVVDAITWSSAVTAGKSRQLNPANTNTVDNDMPANFCSALDTQTYGTANNKGTPKADNACQ
jgi:hypothetical protein